MQQFLLGNLVFSSGLDSNEDSENRQAESTEIEFAGQRYKRMVGKALSSSDRGTGGQGEKTEVLL